MVQRLRRRGALLPGGALAGVAVLAAVILFPGNTPLEPQEPEAPGVLTGAGDSIPAGALAPPAAAQPAPPSSARASQPSAPSATHSSAARSVRANTVPEPAVRRGRVLIDREDCLKCHSIGGDGGTVAPAFDRVGTRRTAAWIREQLLDPEARNPETVMPSYGHLPSSDLDSLADYLGTLR